MSHPVLESDALVLNCRDHGESDKIITFYSRDAGRFSGIAKGANRSLKRFVNKLEVFSYIHVNYQLPKGRELAFVQDAELINAFLPLRQNYQLYCGASVVQEILLIALDDKEKDPNIFRLALWVLHTLEQGRSPAASLQFFMIRLFDLLGYRLNLSACVECGIQVDDTTTFSFDYGAGGIVCKNCRNPGLSESTSLSVGTIRILNQAMSLPLERLQRLQLSGKLLVEAKTVLYRYGRLLFQKDLQSWKLVKGL